ncbi:MAG: tetratricopeptide repeat protein [Gammaproteobacteria bacterium]
MSFFGELKRRNVVKVTVLYVVGAWLLLQVTDVLSSLLPVPEWAGSLVFMLLVVGFPPVLVFSWVYEITPEGLQRQKDIDRSQSIATETGHKINVLIVVLLVLAIGVVAVDRLVPEDGSGNQPAVVEAGEDPQTADEIDATAAKFLPTPDTSIAVLPFVNISSDQEQEYFSDGLSEELLNLLARVPQLKVAARTSSFSLKGKDLQISEVGSILKVAHVLEGSVRKSGNQVRITAQLIHAEDGYHMWSQTYDRTLEDIFAVQDEIANEVVAQLKVTLLGAAPKVEESDPEAYVFVLQARHLGRLGTAEGWASAQELYEQALAIDPDYAAAWNGLAATYISQANKAERPVEEGYTLAREAATRALLIDPDNAVAHAILGQIADVYDRDLAAAARYIEHALALDPTDTDIQKQAAAFAMGLGRIDEAIVLINNAIARDPVNVSAHRMLGLCYYAARQFDSSIAALRTALNLSPASIGAHGLLGRSYLLKGQPEKALAIIEQEQSDWTLIELPLVYYALGQIDQSDAVLAELIEKYAQYAAVNIAAIYSYRSESAEAFGWLDQAVATNDPGLTEIIDEPLFANLRDDPRWLLFMERIGRSPAQLSAIEFEITLPKRGQ